MSSLDRLGNLGGAHRPPSGTTRAIVLPCLVIRTVRPRSTSYKKLRPFGLSLRSLIFQNVHHSFDQSI